MASLSLVFSLGGAGFIGIACRDRHDPQEGAVGTPAASRRYELDILRSEGWQLRQDVRCEHKVAGSGRSEILAAVRGF